MAASAERIDFVDHSARRVANQGGLSSVLIVNFKVFRRGPAHVAGLTFTTDFWVTPREAIARFQRFDGDSEVWQATASVPGHGITFEYVIFCYDHRDYQNVRKIYHTNFGNTFHIAATSF
jgi:hypothetical protein